VVIVSRYPVTLARRGIAAVREHERGASSSLESEVNMQSIHASFRASVIALSLVAAAGCAGTHSEKADKLSVKDVPESVMHSVNARFPGASVSSVEKEKEHGVFVYDLELKHEGRKYEMDVTDDGTVQQIEKEVALSNVPASVTSAVHAKYPNATIKEVMEVNTVKGKTEKPDHYEVVVVNAGKQEEVVVALDGSTVKDEDEDEGE
jgi:hypothetical protein